MKINLPSKVKKTLYVTVETRGALQGDLCILDFDKSQYKNEWSSPVLVCTTEIEVSLPEDFEIAPPLIESLEKVRESIVQEFTIKLDEVDRDLAEARALPSPKGE